MSARDAAEFLTQLVAAAILVASFVRWVRDRSAASRDVFLLFLTLLTTSTLSFIGRVVPIPSVVSQVGGALLVAHPYFVIRVLHSMRAVPRAALWPAFAGAALSVGWLIFIQEEGSEPGIGTELVVLYLAATDIYAGFAMLRGALQRSGISALRLRLGSYGLALVGLVMAQVGLIVAVPELDDVGSITVQVTAALTVLMLFLGFSSPWWLARIALRSTAARFAYQRSLGVVEQRDVASIISALIQWSADSTGGSSACLARWDVDSERLVPTDGDISWLAGRELGPDDVWAWEAWKTQTGRVASVRELTEDLRAALDAKNVTDLYAVPVHATSGAGGLLIITLKGRPLFPDSELRLVEMLVQLSVMEMGYASLRERQENLIRELSVVNEQLLDTNKELESFSYTVSHDLRAPLRAINGFVSMVLAEEPDLSTESVRKLDVARTNARKLGELIDGLLDFSRLGRQSIRHERVDLHALIEEAVDEVMASVPPNRDVIFKVAPSIPDCLGDPLLLRQALTNLLTNAVKFTATRPHARVDVDVVDSQVPDQVTLRIKDNGVGFDMRYAEKIFGVFERVHRSDIYDGNGIGLALVHRIVSRHGGMSWASSVPNRSASFYIALPNADPTTDTGAPEDVEPQAGETDAALRS